MNFIRNITYSKGFRNIARVFHLSNFSRKVYFLFFKPSSGKISINIGNFSSDFYVRSPGELRVLESTGGGGTGEKAVLESLISKIKEGEIAFDIGGHVGMYSLFLAKKVGNAGKVFVFEPEIDNFNHLQDNIKLNNLNNIVTFKKALSDKSGSGKLYLGEEMSNSSLNGAIKDGKKYEMVEIEIGDDFIEKNNLPIPNFVKIDVEGHEYNIINGMSKTLSDDNCRLLFCEIHTSLIPTSVKADDILNSLKKYGFNKIETSKRDSEIHVLAEKV